MRSFILSDVHLCEAVPGDGLCLRFRQKPYFPDRDFSAMLTALCAQYRDEPMEVVFNGDLFDFDAPVVENGVVQFQDRPRTEAVAVEMLTRILRDHDGFVDALGAWIASGHRVVFISGNHDAQLVFPRVRLLLTEQLLIASRAHGLTVSDGDLSTLILFRPWYYTTSHGVHVEHGHQYDWLCSYRYPTEPFTHDGISIQPNVGSLTTRYLSNYMGYFNPFIDQTISLSFWQYIRHWLRYYFFSFQSIGLVWIRGAWKTVRYLWRFRSRKDAERERRMLVESLRVTSCTEDDLRRHTALFEPPSESKLFGVLRELWLDRVGIVGACAGVLIGMEIGQARAFLWITTLGVLLVGLVAYELFTPKLSMREIYLRMNVSMRKIAEIYGARAVVFSHTHISSSIRERGVFYANTGTWAAAYEDLACTIPMTQGRPVVCLYPGEDGALECGLSYWRQGAFLSADVP